MGTLTRQPNGKYCSINYYGKVDFFNYTEQDVINMYIEKAKEEIKNAKSYGEIIAKIEFGDSYKEKSDYYDEYLKSIGFDKPYNELTKFIPRKPLNQKYISCDFATHGNCPNCNGHVVDGIGGTDKKCRCGQMLKWD
jgi:hypothetical protein